MNIKSALPMSKKKVLDENKIYDETDRDIKLKI
jgi:hypothetical protein